MTTQTDVIAQPNAPGRLRKMSLGEFDRFTALIETAFAEDQAREGRSFRDEIRSLNHLLPLFKIMFAVAPGMEDYFYTIVWDVDGRFASAVTISRQGSDAQRWYIANVATHPDYRGRGLARALVAAALDRIRRQGGRNALLRVCADNEPAYRLYRSLGFQHLETGTILKGLAHPIAASALPGAYTLGQSRQRTGRRVCRRATGWLRLKSDQCAAERETVPGQLDRTQPASVNQPRPARDIASLGRGSANQPIGLVTCPHGGGSNSASVADRDWSEHLGIAGNDHAYDPLLRRAAIGCSTPLLIDLVEVPQARSIICAPTALRRSKPRTNWNEPYCERVRRRSAVIIYHISQEKPSCPTRTNARRFCGWLKRAS
jgi:GNAT superfamily N-acetyltransferase